ncbi:MAG: hypothetical protein ACK5LZ_05440 [Anaerorhabdus sp.]
MKKIILILLTLLMSGCSLIESDEKQIRLIVDAALSDLSEGGIAGEFLVDSMISFDSTVLPIDDQQQSQIGDKIIKSMTSVLAEMVEDYKIDDVQVSDDGTAVVYVTLNIRGEEVVSDFTELDFLALLDDEDFGLSASEIISLTLQGEVVTIIEKAIDYTTLEFIEDIKKEEVEEKQIQINLEKDGDEWKFASMEGLFEEE